MPEMQFLKSGDKIHFAQRLAAKFTIFRANLIYRLSHNEIMIMVSSISHSCLHAHGAVERTAVMRSGNVYSLDLM